ncbi:MAG: permease, partial [Armatimonadota bacterium]
SVASISGTILAVCSCTVLPLFAGIYTRGAGLGPAAAFLYSGPAINVLAIILTARVLGYQMGVARAVGAVGFAFIIGLVMHTLFRKEEKEKMLAAEEMFLGEAKKDRPLWKTGLYFSAMIGILVFANWGKPLENQHLWAVIYHAKWAISGTLLVLLAIMLAKWFTKAELQQWVSTTWEFSLQILPLLFAGVLVAGFALGRPGHEGIIPSAWVSTLVGGNSLFSNFVAALSGALMYFATLTEVPILQGLMGAGMGKGPALALLLAGPSLSLPSMLVINRIMGPKKTLAYVTTVVVMATVAGVIYGMIPS